MENLNAEEIIKALGYCVIGDCEPCAYRKILNCQDHMCGDALSLIKALTEENERLRVENKGLKTQSEKSNCEIEKRFIEYIKTSPIIKIDERKMLEYSIKRRQKQFETHFGKSPKLDQIVKEMLEGEK